MTEPMEPVTFSVLNGLEHQHDVVRMMRSLYEEDEAAHPVEPSRFPATVAHLVAHPAAGQIVLFRVQAELAGYSILIPYWSNEFGGILLFIDELFVTPAWRSRGIATRFLRFLETQPPFAAVALALEVTPANHRANRLYASLGFSQRPNATLIRPVSPPNL